MQIRFTFLNFIYIINIFSFSSYAQHVTYLPNSNQGQAQQQYYNPGTQNGGNGMPPQPFNQNNMIAPFQYQNGMIQTPQQQFQPANLQNNNPNINNQNGQINNEMQPAPVFQQQYQYDPNQSNMQNNINNNNQMQQQFGQTNSNEQVDITPDSLVIMPENSGTYYVAAPDVFPLDMIQSDMKDSNGNNTNENGFWLFISRMKDLNKQVIDQIQNRTNNNQANNNQINSDAVSSQINDNNNTVQPIIDNNMSNNHNNTGNVNNNASNSNNEQSNNNVETNNNQSPIVNNKIENGQIANNSSTSNVEQSNNSSTDNNKQFNNNQSEQDNNQQLPLQIDAKDVTMINNDSNNTTIVDNNTPIMLTPVSVNGNTVCAITRAKPSQKNDNLPTLSDSQQQTVQN